VKIWLLKESAKIAKTSSTMSVFREGRKNNETQMRTPLMVAGKRVSRSQTEAYTMNTAWSLSQASFLRLRNHHPSVEGL
jgi:hypothetical protein